MPDQSKVGTRPKSERLVEFLEHFVWPKAPLKALGRPVTKREKDKILGYGRIGAK